MRQLWLLLLLMLASVLPAWSQSGTTLVTAKVVDTGGSIYVNCSWSVVFVGENTTPGAGPYAPAPLLNGQQGACDSQGNLSVNLADNVLTVFPQPSQWSFSICSAGGYLGGPFCKVNIPITITGSTQNISSILTPLMPLLPTGGGAGGGPTLFPSTPTGICTPSQTGVNTSTGDYYSCAGGSWLKVGPISSSANPGGSAFQLQTNTSGVAFGGVTNVTAGSVLASQGTGAFPAFQLKPVFDAIDYGATGNGVTNDLVALQNTVAAADAAGGGTVLLRAGTYYIGSSTWKIGTANSQHHINVEGVNTNSTVINSTVSGTTPAIYLNIEKYVTISNFSLTQTGTLKTGYGLVLGGDGGTGTETNGNTVSHVTIYGFDHNVDTSAGIGTSSEISFDHLVSNSGNYGFYSANYNALNFVFTELEMFNDVTAGVATFDVSNIKVNGGASNNNGVDFYLHATTDATSVISSFRSEVPTGVSVDCAGQAALTLQGYIVTGYASPNSTTAIQTANCRLSILGSKIGGQIVFIAGAYGTLDIQDSIIVDPNNTWSLSNQSGSAPDGPGFYLHGVGGSFTGSTWNIQNVSQANNNADTIIGRWPNSSGYVTTPSNGFIDAAIALNQGTSNTALTVTSNTIKPYAYIHHVGAGLIKTITAPPEAIDLVSCLQLIPDAAFTTDATGNISVALTATIGQAITFCYDPVAAKWYPGGGGGGSGGSFSTLSGGTNTSAAMLVGSGASLGWTSSGRIDASTLLGGTWGAPALPIGNVVPVPGNSAFTSLAATGTVDFTGSGIAKLRVAAGLTTSANGDVGYDSTNANWHFWNGADLLMVPLAAGFVSGDCPQPTLVSGKWTLQDAGGNCSTGGGSGLSGMTTGQVPIAATSTTITSSKALAGSGAGITTGPASGVTTLDVAEFTGTGGQIADSSVLVANLTTAASNYTSGDLIQAAGANKTTSDSAIATANVVTAASNFTSGHIPKAAGSNKTLADGYPVQGTDTNLLSSGTVSGTAVLLCTDANGGATTSGCPSTGGNVSTSGTITSGQIAIWASTTTIKSAAMSGDGTLSSAGVLTNIGLNGTLLSGLATGILKNTTSTGVPSIAISSDVISIFTGCSASPTTTYLRADGSCQAPPGSGTINPSLQFSMPYYSAAGSSTTISGSPAPTGPNGIAQTFCTTPSGSAATLGVWCIPGVPIDAQTGTSYTIPITDDVTFLTGSNASATAWTGFALANNYAFSFANLGAGLITYTPASGTVNGNATQIIPKNYFGFHYTDNTNTFMPVMPTIAAFPNCPDTSGNHLNINTATGAITCGTTASGAGISGMTTGQVAIAGSASTITSSEGLAGGGAGITTGPVSGVTTLDLTEFTGTGGQIADSGILAANVVTQTSNAVSGQVCTYTGTNKVCVPATALPNGITATTQTAGDSSTDVATDAFVATGITNAIAAVNPATAVLAASTANLTGTYAQVGGGVGDTFTVTATGAFTLDGIAINTIGQRVLLKNQTTASQNGIYTATVVGTTGVSPIFTRALDYDMPSDVNNTGSIPVQSGTVNTTTSWLLTSQVTSIGSSGSSLTYAQFSYNPVNVALLNVAQTWSALQTFGTLLVSGGLTYLTGTSDPGTCTPSFPPANGDYLYRTDLLRWKLCTSTNTFTFVSLASPALMTLGGTSYSLSGPVGIGNESLPGGPDILDTLMLQQVDTADTGNSVGISNTKIWAPANNAGAFSAAQVDNLSYIAGTGTAMVVPFDTGVAVDLEATGTALTVTQLTGVSIKAPTFGSNSITTAYGLLIGNYGSGGAIGTGFSIKTGTGAVSFGDTTSAPNFIAGTDNSVAGTMQLANGSAAAHTIFGSGATTTNTINGFATVPTTGHLIDCTVTSTTCLMHDHGLIVAADITNNTITGTQLASSLALVTPNIGAATGTSLLASGIVDGKAPITVTTGTTATLGAATYQSGYTFNQEATAGTGVTYTLPATAAGLQYCVRNSIVSGTGAADTGVLTVYPPSSSYVILNGVRNTIGGGGTHGVASGGAAGDSACFVAIDATDWEVYVQRGTWTAN